MRRVSHGRFCLIVLSLSLGTHFGAPRVLVADDSKPLDVSLEELTGKQVTATSKTQQKLTEALASIIVISAEEIRRFGCRTLAEVLQRVSGLTISDDRIYQYLGVRGLNIPGDFNGRVLLLIDGHKVNDPNYDYVPLGEDFPLDIENIERVEISKGTSASVWGTNAVFAVVNVTSKKGRQLSGSEIKSEYGSFARRKIVAQHGGNTKEGAEYSFGAAAVNSNGQRKIYIPEFDTPESNNGISANDDGFTARRAYLRYAYKGTKFLLNHGSRDKAVAGAPYGSIFDSQMDIHDQSTQIEVNTTQALAPDTITFVRAYHDWVGYHSPFKYADGDGGEVLNYDESRTRIFGSEARLLGNFGDGASYIIGSEYQSGYDIVVKNSYPDGDGSDDYSLRGDYQLFSLYGEGKIPIVEGLSGVLGGRYDKYNIFRRELSPRFGFIYEATDRLTGKIIYGRAFRIPNNFERTPIDSDGAELLPKLRPEVGVGYEGITIFRLSKDTSLQTSAFRYRLDHLIRSLDDQTTTTDNVNFGSATSRGIDLWFHSRSDDEIIIYLGAMYAEVTDNHGALLPNAPHAVGSIGLSQPLWDGLIYVSPEMRWVGAVKTIQGGTIPDRLVSNLTFGSAKFFDKWSTSLSIYDLFDSDRPSVVGPQYSFDRISPEGRTLRLQLGCSF